VATSDEIEKVEIDWGTVSEMPDGTLRAIVRFAEQPPSVEWISAFREHEKHGELSDDGLSLSFPVELSSDVEGLGKGVIAAVAYANKKIDDGSPSGIARRQRELADRFAAVLRGIV
jgi:hypothetical protein